MHCANQTQFYRYKYFFSAFFPIHWWWLLQRTLTPQSTVKIRHKYTHTHTHTHKCLMTHRVREKIDFWREFWRNLFSAINYPKIIEIRGIYFCDSIISGKIYRIKFCDASISKNFCENYFCDIKSCRV